MFFWQDRHRRILTLICLVCTGLVLFLHLNVPAYQEVELLARDLLATNYSARLSPRHPDLIYLGIDEASINLDTLFPEDIEESPTLRMMKAGWPWNRAVYSAVIDRLLDAGAKAVVFDVLLPNQKAGDSTLQAALEEKGGKVVLGSNLIDTNADDGRGTGRLDKKTKHILPSTTIIPADSPLESCVGFVNVREDPDKKIRRVHFRTTQVEYVGQRPLPGLKELYSLPARALQKAGYESVIPAGHDEKMIRFCESILPRSLHEIFVDSQWKNPPYNGGELFRGKIVLVGATGNQSEDRLQTPFGVVLGPTLHLSAMNAALNDDFLIEPHWGWNAAIIVLAGSLAWLLGAKLRRPMLRLILLFLLLAGLLVGIQLLYNTTGFFPILMSPILALGSSGITWSVWEQVLDLRDKAKLRRTFERYVSRDVVKELVDNPASWLNTLGGSKKKITVLFSDVRDFTTLTEAADDLQVLFRQLNEYFDEMVNLVFANRGTLDKFIGDAVMAHWGSISSENEKEDATSAVRTALQMRRTLARLNPQWKERGLIEFHFGIGINQGEAAVGNLGCDAKMEFSVIGDAVNLASRLEGVTKKYRIDLCIGEQVAALVKDTFILRSLDLILVKGKTKPVEIFAVLDERTPTATEPEWLANHEEAMKLYRKGDFAAAETLWFAVRAKVPKDSIAEVFLERCANLREEDPDETWTGVYEMTSK